ncbi:DinB family protein [Citrobacter sp. JGM124]|uniref:DinB family protein n=1 Tax=Citrobacter sp. JGM124 TaxID=2799789 RepID=UPI001BA67E19|nr:DinB family protein [Citrobacter sp. JGM124]MBS0847565.1 DinB family protein [Citrobacter sp. JGM124]
MNKDTLVTLLKYKRWIDSATLETIKGISAPSCAEKRHLMLRLMNHIYVVDMIFKANILGQPHGYTALNTPETPSVDDLAVNVAASTDWYIQHVNTMAPADLEKTITFTFVDGGNGEMTAIDMLNHVLFHGAYHRGAIGWLISECGAVPPKDVLTVFLRDHNH